MVLKENNVRNATSLLYQEGEGILQIDFFHKNRIGDCTPVGPVQDYRVHDSSRLTLRRARVIGVAITS